MTKQTYRDLLVLTPVIVERLDLRSEIKKSVQLTKPFRLSLEAVAANADSI